MKRSGFKPRAEPMARGTTQMKRGKRMGPGKVRVKHRLDIMSAKDAYFGDEDTRPCQYCGRDMDRKGCTMHHKTQASELRKAKVKDIDAPHRLLAIHQEPCHRKIHGRGRDGFGTGRPKDEREADEFRVVETAPANAENGQIIQRLP